MGVTYSACIKTKNKKTVKIPPHAGWHGNFLYYDVNFSGADLLGHIHLKAKAGITDAYPRFEGDTPRVPYTADKSQCAAWASKIEKLTKSQLKEILDECPCFDGSADEFQVFVNDWAWFLKNCGGYEVP